MKTRTKRILVLIGAMGLFAGAWGCDGDDPLFPEDSADYQLAYDSGELHVSFEATPVSSWSDAIIGSVDYWATISSQTGRRDAICTYTGGGSVRSGGAMECLVSLTDFTDIRDDEITIHAHGEATLNGVTRGRTSESPSLNLSHAMIVDGIDADSDGVGDDDDTCADTPEDERDDVDENGCHDTDADGVPNDDDECDDTPEGDEIGEDGCPPPSDPVDATDPVDTDGDGVNDFDESGAPLDNCPGDYNVDQADGDGDGTGDACDDATAGTAGGPGGGGPGGGTYPFAGPGGAGAGANMAAAESNCALMETAAFNPALFILLGAALLPIVRLRRK